MIYHVVHPDEWNAGADRPYAPASLAEDGFVHCSPDAETTLAVVNAFYRTGPRPLLALVLDEERLAARCAWEAADPAPPPGVSPAPCSRTCSDRWTGRPWCASSRSAGTRTAGRRA